MRILIVEDETRLAETLRQLMEDQRYQADILEELPEIDGIMGTGCFGDIVPALEQVMEGRECRHFADINGTVEELPRVLSTPRHYAYLRIAEGCSNRCAYCVIPSLRGNYRSRRMEEILAEAVLYGRVYLVGLPFLMLYDLTKECIMGCGDSKTPLRAVVATSMMNIVLDLALIGPFGVAGAAGATVAAQIAGAGYMLAHLRKTELNLPFRREMLKASYAKDIFRLSAPNSLQQASGTIITTVKQGLLGGLGVAAIAGFSCAGKLSSLLMMPVYGFVQSIVFFIAQNTTAQQPDRVHTGLREGRRILFFYSLLVAALCIGLNGPLLRLFTTDAAAAAYGSTMLAFEGISYVFTAQKHLCEARLRGAQKMGLYLASNLGQIGLNLAACVLLVPRIGFSGFWLSTWISAPAGLALAALLARIGAKQQS